MRVQKNVWLLPGLVCCVKGRESRSNLVGYSQFMVYILICQAHSCRHISYHIPSHLTLSVTREASVSGWRAASTRPGKNGGHTIRPTVKWPPDIPDPRPWHPGP